MSGDRWTFRISRCLGRGGFGEVYRAEMTSPSGLVTPVALKVLRADALVPGAALARLKDEARMLARLEHPCILQVHDLVLLEGRVALVTELVEGIDLERALFGEIRMGPRAIAAVLARTASALDAAYNATPGDSGSPLRLVHRDVKPSNIRVGVHAEVKLLDFGIAHTDEMTREARTKTDALLGSPPYMAPERFLGEPAHPAADVFALGAIAAEALLGERLFSAPITTLAALSLEPGRYRGYLDARLITIPSDAPADYLALVKRLLDFDPVARPSAAEAASAFDALADTLPGDSLARFCREILSDRWDTPAGHGELDGRTLTSGSSEISLPASSPAASTMPISGSLAWSTSPTQTPRTKSGPPMLGRSEELTRLAGSFYEGRALLTVRGTAGVGKTRLVQEHLAQIAAAHPSLEIVKVSLASLSNRAELLSAVALALSLPLLSGGEEAHVKTIGQALAMRAPCVLSLDNAEQIAEITAQVVSRWLCKGVQILVTSRRALGLPEERILDLEPLQPDDALALMLDRALRARWDYEPSQDEIELLRSLARTELDGLPLAIELAGARLGLLEVQDLAEDLRGNPSEGLAAALQSSFRLLGPEAQRAFARLGAFGASFDRKAAEAVLGAAALEQLRTFLDHSLLQRDGTRFRLLDAIGSFARERAAAFGELDAAREQHRRYFAQASRIMLEATERSAALPTPEQLAEQPNLLAAHRSAVEHGDIDSAVPLACWLDRILTMCGPISQREPLLRATSALLPRSHPGVIDIGWRLGDALRAQGQIEEARAVLEETLTRGRALGRTAEAWTALLALHAQTNDIAAIRACFEEALAAIRAAKDLRREGLALQNRALAELWTGDIAQATARLRDAVALFHKRGDIRLEISGLMNLASCLPPNDERLDLLAHALALARAHKLVVLEAGAALNLATLRVRRGELSAALEAYERAEKLTQRIGDTNGGRYITHGRAAALLDLGRFEEAEAALDELQAGERDEITDWGLLLRGILERMCGRPAAAELSFRAVITTTRGDPALSYALAYAEIQLAALFAEMGRLDEASKLAEKAGLFYRSGGDTLGIAITDIALAQIAFARGASREKVEAMLAGIDLRDQDAARMVKMLRACMR